MKACSKAHTALTKARAEDVGSDGYIWRSVRDGATRPSHRAMEGKFVKWGEPPTLDGMTGHAGEFPNCRCYPEPVIPRSDGKGVYASPLPTFEQEQASGKKPLTQWEKTQAPEIIDLLEQKIGVAKGAPIPMADAARYANPDFNTNQYYQQNCQRCMKTFELRRRGYPVTAMPRPAHGTGTSKRRDMFGWEGFKNPEIHGYLKDLKPNNIVNPGATIINKQALMSDLQQLPDGARVGICYQHPPKIGGAHIMVCEKKGGKLIFMDPQTGAIGNHALGNAWTRLGYAWFRTDNLDLDESFEWDEVVKGGGRK